jgi:hypothetical protein
MREKHHSGCKIIQIRLLMLYLYVERHFNDHKTTPNRCMK